MKEQRRLLSLLLLAAVVGPSVALDNGLGKTPPMGWSSWNHFFESINATLFMEMADAMANNGFRAAGYQYINIDAGYLQHQRDANGNLQVDTTKFPQGIRPVADHVHSVGLKLGVYTDIGVGSCGPGPGSSGHYLQDAMLMAHNWTIDYLKTDYCGPYAANLTEYEAWAELRDALNKTGRPIYYSICPKTVAPDYGTATPYAGQRVYSPPSNWTRDERAALANSILVEYVNLADTWYSPNASDCVNVGAPCGMITNFDSILQMTMLNYSQSGSWNDGDMLQICNMGFRSTGMTHDGYRAAFSLWCVLASPLILSADLRSTAPAEVQSCLKDIALNTEAIAINQDPAALPAFLVEQTSTITPPLGSVNVTSNIVARPLADGSFGVVLFNRRPYVEHMSVRWQQLGWPSSQMASVRDIWLRQDMGNFSEAYGANVPAQGVVFIRVTPLN